MIPMHVDVEMSDMVEKMPVMYTILKGLILTLLVLVTIIGNVLVCLSVILVRKLRKPQNYLLVSLAVSDLFVALIVMPFAMVFELNEATWPLSNGLCDLWVSADVLSCTASILNLCAISVDRYQAITRPLEYSSVSSPKRMLAVIFAVWLSAACVSLPPVLLLGNEHKNQDCAVSQNFWYQIYATMASFYVPLCVMVVVYVKILRVVAEKKKCMTWTNNSRSSSVDRNAVHMDMHYPHTEKFRPAVRLKDHKASTTLGIIMSAFIICWLPFFVLALVRPFLKDFVAAEIPGWINSLFLWLGYANSALNPVIYATLNRDFRRPFREILCLRCSTLDDLMRREFYDHQYGGDEYYIRNKKKLGGVVGTDSVSGVNSVCGRASNKQRTGADQLQLPNYQNSCGPLSSPSQNTITTSTAIIRGSPWTTSNRKTFETQLTTDPETDIDVEGDGGEGVSWTSG
ncbi:unnamed protein product [Orchesella dallaii]|uniref:G-protein coupled receptors family 1 profile domain-containing protein n=1 Tax=Orchesella dallaii TaxID=48710 RepID=A0ABP1QUI4_9HEXA